MSKKEIRKDYTKELAEDFQHWDLLYRSGGSDPFYADGLNLNLVRNHIIYDKKQLEKMIKDGNYPDIYYRETPPEVDNAYMARADEIRDNAKRTLMVYQLDSHYIWCKSHAAALQPKELKCFPVENILGYVKTLASAIETDDLITMRRHETPERYLDSFARCEQEMRRMFSSRTAEPQMSLFDFLTSAEDSPDSEEGEVFDNEIQSSM